MQTGIIGTGRMAQAMGAYMARKGCAVGGVGTKGGICANGCRHDRNASIQNAQRPHQRIRRPFSGGFR